MSDAKNPTSNPELAAAFKKLLAFVADGGKLSQAQAEEAFEIIMSGNATPSQMGAMLMGLRLRGETVDEIAGAARVMRAKAVPIQAPPGAIDTCGTGGDASGTYNISTGAALVVAACGVPVAKHGNRAASSKSGSADVLAALGVNLDADMALVAESLKVNNIGFMMAPRHHAAMRHVGPTRVELGTRTIFNLLGPLANPASAKRQLLGVFHRQWVKPVAEVLGTLGSERAWVVHGSDGLDELTTTGTSYVAELKDGKVTAFEVTPEDAGLTRVTSDALKGGDPVYNAQAVTAMLGGATGPYRDIVLLNAAAALIVAGKAADLKAGVKLAAEAIASGKAKATLASLVATSTKVMA
jgi:anthranilate phosphoribosyltransferase